ncbi:MAG: hypothetical protein IKH05_10170 [Bacteroidaceae bacterium]|nr:hypothetical protein [Bacteroidaceae bacterium]
MKKKFYQILLLGAVTVSLGMFVSCKDTNSDLYKQLEWQIDEKASLEEVNRLQLQQLEQMKQYIQDQLALVEKCNCPANMSQTIQDLTDFMNKMNQAASDNDNSFETLKELLQGITNNYETVNNFFNNMGVSEQQLNNAVNDLEAKIAAIKKCECDLSKLSQIEQAAQQAYDMATKADSTVKVAMNIANAAKTAAETASGQVQTLSTQVQQALDKAGSAENIAKEAKSLVADLDSIAKAADKLSKENAEKIQQNSDAIKDMKMQMVSMSDSLKHAYETADKAFTQASANKTAIELIDARVKADSAAIKGLQTTVADMKTATDKIPGLETKVNGIETSVTTLFNKVDSLGVEIDTLKVKVNKAYDYADAKLLEAKKYTDLEISLVKAALTDSIAAVNGRIDGVVTDVDSINSRIGAINISIKDLRDQLDDEVDDLWTEITKLQQKDAQISDNLAAYKDSINTVTDKNGKDIIKALGDIVKLNNAVDLINDSLGVLGSRIDGNTVLIQELDDKLDSAMVDFQDKIDILQAQIDSLGKCVAQNTSDIEKLTGAFNLLQENLKRQVTGIIVQGTYNPAFGTVNLPVGIQSNVLLTYYGEAMQTIEFPTNSTANYVDEKHVLTTKDMEMLGLKGKDPLYKVEAGDIILQNEENNAGTLFLTVNPNTVDFSKLQLSLVNSQDKESYIKLGELKRSDKTLQLGYSRAADNGFYECAANLDAADVNKVQKVNFNTAALKDAIKEITDKQTNASISRIASDMAEVIRGLRIDANAVKCEWTDSAKAGETPQKHAVYSNYNMAATAIKPLSLQTAKDFHYQTVPGYERAMSLLDRLSKEAKDRVHVVFKELNGNGLVEKIANLKIKDISAPDLKDDLLQEFVLNMDTTFVIDGMSYTLDLHETVNVPVKFTQDVTVPINIDQEVAVDMSNVLVNTPTIVVTTDVKNGSGGATLEVPVKTKVPDKVNGGEKDSIIGKAIVNLDDIDVDANASIEGSTIKLDGQAVAHIQYNKDQKITISVDQTFPAKFDFSKTLYFGDNGTSQKSFNLKFKYDMRKSAKDLWGVAQDALNDINTGLLSDIRDIIGEVNKTLDQINGYEVRIDNTVDNYIDKAREYLDKINKKIVGFVNSTNQRLQPTLIASDGTGAKMLSEAKNYPTVFTGSNLSLVPTTWTLELVVPIAKKHVAVTDVIYGNKSAKEGDSSCKSELSRVNDSPTMNVVLPGEQRRAYVTNLKSGYTYEIAYSALDFHGKMSTRKYYITIK